MRGVDREGRQDREDLVDEALAQLGLAGPLIGSDDADAFFRQLLADAVPGVRLLCLELEHAPADAIQLLAGGEPIRRGLGVTRGHLLHQARDAHLEELVEVAGEDGQEADALEERVAGVLCLVQHALVEVQPAELPRDEGEAGLAGRSAAGAGAH